MKVFYIAYLQALLIIQLFSGNTILNIYAVKILNELFNTQDYSRNFQNQTFSFNCSSSLENSTSTLVTSSEAYISGICTVLVRLTSSLILAGLLMKLRRRFMFMTSALLTTTFLVSFATLNYFIQHENSEGKTFLTLKA